MPAVVFPPRRSVAVHVVAVKRRELVVVGPAPAVFVRSVPGTRSGPRRRG